jgi:hypothetical protein
MRLQFGNPVINVLGYFFIRNCRRELRRKETGAELSDADLLVARIRDHTQQVFDRSVMAPPDPQARVIYAYCSLLLAAFREFRAGTGDDAGAYAFARTVFQQTMERPSTISTGGDSCRFRFIRDHDKRGVEPVDVVLVQLQKPPYAAR